MAAVQRTAVQRRAIESGTAAGTRPPSKIARISSRCARPLQRRVRRGLGYRLLLSDGVTISGAVYDRSAFVDGDTRAE